MEKCKRLAAWAAVVVGVALGVVSAGPWSWGLGIVVAVALLVGAGVVLTDQRAKAEYLHRREGPLDWNGVGPVDEVPSVEKIARGTGRHP